MNRNQRDRTDWRASLARMRLGVRRRVRPGWRLVVGILLILGGLVGFLPVLGFWMIPLGIVVAALDVKPMMRRRRARRNQTPDQS